MEDERRDSNGTIGEGQKPGALKIYDGALSEGFSDDLIEIFNTNEKAHTRNQNDTLNFLEYNYTTNHKDEDVHKRLMEHTGQLYKHYLEDLGTTNMIKASGFEEIKIHKYEQGVGHHDLHVDAVDHESAIRAVAFTWFLNETDGNIDYPLQRIGIEARKGRVIITPVSWEYASNNHISKESDKYMLQTYLHLA